ncbi:sel1 repeat family protein [Alphaproteobacteria bacterium]|nr:sel1 repeat family protein [Alphaproteobacteria bacterium]
MKTLFTIPLVLMSLMSFPSWGDEFNLGMRAFESGDYKTALEKWSSSALNGNPTAANNVGKMLRNGLGVSQDHKSAVEWFLIGHRMGNRESSYNLAIAYDQGMGGVEKNETTAFNFYHESAKKGFSDAQYNLGLRYARGVGVKPDLTLSYVWFEIVVNSDRFMRRGTIEKSKLTLFSNEDALAVMDLIAKNISPSDLILARRIARECVANDYINC